jgi:transcriptional regulator with XRE-family HTH domain
VTNASTGMSEMEREASFSAKQFAWSVLNELSDRNWSFRVAARHIGISAASLNRICRGRSPSVESYLRIVDYFGFTRPSLTTPEAVATVPPDNRDSPPPESARAGANGEIR